MDADSAIKKENAARVAAVDSVFQRHARIVSSISTVAAMLRTITLELIALDRAVGSHDFRDVRLGTRMRLKVTLRTVGAAYSHLSQLAKLAGNIATIRDSVCSELTSESVSGFE